MIPQKTNHCQSLVVVLCCNFVWYGSFRCISRKSYNTAEASCSHSGHLLDLAWYVLLECVQCRFLGIPVVQCIPSKRLPFGRVIFMCMSHFLPADFLSSHLGFHLDPLPWKICSFRVFSFPCGIFWLIRYFSLLPNNSLCCCHGTTPIERAY